MAFKESNIMASTLPTFTLNIPEIIDAAADAAQAQMGLAKKASFFGDQTITQAHQNFMAGVNTALSYAGQAAMKLETVAQRTESTGYKLTTSEYSLLKKRAQSIANFSKIPTDTCEDFLTLLCFVNNKTDLKKIADAVQIPELDDENIIKNPMQILNIPRLEKISFAASALDGLVNMF